MTAQPITAWYACSRCTHGRRGGALCAHPIAIAAGGAPQPVDPLRRAAHCCGPDGRWHEYAAPLPDLGAAAALAIAGAAAFA